MKISLLCAPALLIAVSSTAADLGFRYRDGKCQNAEGKTGLNLSFLEQCADFQKTLFEKAVLVDVQLADVVIHNSSFQRATLCQRAERELKRAEGRSGEVV